jgi:hypothetical protein
MFSDAKGARSTMETAVTRELDGVHLIFQRYDDLWMIDRVAPDDHADEDEEDDCFAASTAVSRDEVRGLGELDRRRCHARHLRKLALPERGRSARVLWTMISDFDHFSP